MKVLVRGSGGFGGLRIQGELDTADLPPELKRRAEAMLAAEPMEKAMAAAEAATANPHMADAQELEVTVIGEAAGGARSYLLRGGAMDPEVMQLANDLMREVIKRRSAR